MTKTVKADFDPGRSVSLKLWDFDTGVLVYNVALTEVVGEDGSYSRTDTFVTGKYRSGLIVGGFVVQRSVIYIGPNENQVYRIGNWEGTVDIGAGSYYLAGSGAYLVTITVKTDLNVVIQGAHVSLYRAGEQRHGTTNVSGIVQFRSDAVTWTDVVITAMNYVFAGASLVITANTSVTYNGTPSTPVLPPLADHQVHLQAYVFDQYGVLENGVKVKAQLIETPNFPGIFDDAIAEFTSINGIVTLTNMFQDGVYNIWRTKSKPMRYQVPIVAANVVVVEMDPLKGNDNTDPCL